MHSVWAYFGKKNVDLPSPARPEKSDEIFPILDPPFQRNSWDGQVERAAQSTAQDVYLEQNPTGPSTKCFQIWRSRYRTNFKPIETILNKWTRTRWRNSENFSSTKSSAFSCRWIFRRSRWLRKYFFLLVSHDYTPRLALTTVRFLLYKNHTPYNHFELN